MADYDSPEFHSQLINDRSRSEAYRTALLVSIKPGDVVLDIGAGSGILSLFACQAGARKVYAVERGALAGTAAALARANGQGERIEVIHRDLRDIELPEPVDVVVSELMSQGIVGQNLEGLSEYARTRLLRPGGKMIPGNVVYQMAPVHSDSARRSLDAPADGLFGLSYVALRRLRRNLSMPLAIDAALMLAAPREFYRIDSATVTAGQWPRASLLFDVTLDGRCDGLLTWFDSELAAGVHVDSRGSCRCWTPLLFPLSEPLQLHVGERLAVDFSAKQMRSGDSIYRWDTRVLERQGENAWTPRTGFRQSTLNNLLGG